MSFNLALGHFTSSVQTIQQWVSGTAYALNQVVLKDDIIYRCNLAHTASASFDTDSPLYWTSVGAASGGSGINYITNYAAKTSSAGWSTFADGANLVDGTGGSPTAQFARNTSSPLRSTADFLYAPGALGDGVSYDFTVDVADQAKVLSISFDWKPAGNVSEGDYQVWVYRKDATARLIQPAGYKLSAGVAGTKYKHIARFQTDSDATNYRLIIYQTTASTNNIQLTNVTVGPQTVQYGAPVTDWDSYTPTIAGTTVAGSVTYTTQVGKYRRVGDSLELYCRINIGTVTTSPTGIYYVPLPAGINIDSSKSPNGGHAGVGYYTDNGVGNIPIVAVYNSPAGTDKVGLTPTSVTAIPTMGAGDAIVFSILIPIQGWSSSVQMSSDTDTRVVALKANSSASTTIGTGSESVVNFAATEIDTHGTYASSNSYTIPVSGIYEVSASVGFAANGTGIRYVIIDKDGSTPNANAIGRVDNPSSTGYTTITGSVLINCTAGNVLKVKAYQNSGGNLSVGVDAMSHFQVKRLSGPSAIAANETIAARCRITSASTTTSLSTGAWKVLDFNVKDFDSHGAVTTGASWVFTAPVSGTYSVSASIALLAAASSAVDNTCMLKIVKAGSDDVSLGRSLYQTTTSVRNATNGTQLVYLNAGQTVSISGFQNASASVSINTATGPSECTVSIYRVGN